MNTGNPLRAGSVGRVSKDKSGDVRSVAEQQDLNQAEAAANGWLITARYSDAVSASRFAAKARTDWPVLLADIEAGRLDVVLLWDSSRGSREPEDWFGFLRRCRDKRVLIRVTSEHRTYDMASLRDWKTLADDGIDNAYESEKKSRDVQRGLAANAAAGMPHGVTKYGYRRVHDPVTGRLTGQEVNREEADIAAEIIRRIAMAEPVSAVRNDLEARGIPGPGGGRWYRQTVRKLALSEAYIGKRFAGGLVRGRRRVGGELVAAAWPPVIDEPTFWAARAVLTSPARKTTRPGAAKYLLSYIMTCDACGSACYSDMPRKRRRTPLYMCASPRTHCAQVPIAEADDLITRLAIAWASEPDIYPQLVSGSDEQAAAARAEADRLRAELDEWLKAGVSARAYAVKEAEYLPRIGQAERRAEELAVPLPLRALASPGEDIAATWESLAMAARRDVVRMLFAAVRLAPGPGPAQDRITIDWRR